MLITKSKNRWQAPDNAQQGRRLLKNFLAIINSHTPGEESNKPEGNRTDNFYNDKNVETQTKIVLHIDDDPDDRELVQQAIKSIDATFIIVEAENGKAGIDYLKRAKSTGQLPCLIIMDVNMPGIDGFATYNEIKKDEDLRNLPTVVFTTGNFFKAKQNKDNDQLPIFFKPENFKEFADSVRVMLSYRKRN
jgi:CheY-like chemotaxis protein